MKQHTNGLWQRLRRADLIILLTIALVVGGLWLFVELADEVGEGSTATIDERLLLALRDPADASDPLGPLWLEELMRDFTALGGAGILTLLTTGVVGYMPSCWR
jgi:undecaprenyl-diphosphatase